MFIIFFFFYYFFAFLALQAANQTLEKHRFVKDIKIKDLSLNIKPREGYFFILNTIKVCFLKKKLMK
jgi:hypothetical protein